MKSKCVIIGSGTYGQVYARYLDDLYSEIVFTDNESSLKNTIINGVKVIGHDDFALANLDPNIYDVYVPLGNVKVRRYVINQFKEKGFNLPNYIHPSVNIDKTVNIGEEAIYILEGTLIMPFVNIHNGVMISVSTIIAHHTTLNSGVFISAGSNIGASININENAFIGISSTVMTGVKEIGEDSIIGAGTVVIRDVPAKSTVVGNPAREIKSS